MAKDYLAMVKPSPKDKVDHGIKGMKWGIRRSKEEIAAAPKGGSASEAAKPSGPETSTQRYDRLLAQAKKSGGNSLTDEELRFVTNRGNAIAQVNRLNEQKPDWLKDATSQVLKQAAKKSMQAITNEVAKKYIHAPVVDALNNK